MAGPCATCSLSPCCCGGSFTSLDDICVDGTLARALIPCVDQMRDLYTCFGLRAYKVTLIATRWSGGARGRGVEEVVRQVPILPTPLIGDLNAISTEQLAIGDEEIGTLQVSEISGRFTEDELRGLSLGGEPIADDEQFYWEVEFAGVSGSPKRRFYPSSAPNYKADDFQWKIELVKISEDRERNGDVA